MRIVVTLKGFDGFVLPFNYNYVLASLIYNLLGDSEYAGVLHDGGGFKFFTFSDIFVRRRRVIGKGIVCLDGVFSFTVSSVSVDFMSCLLSGLVGRDCVCFYGVDFEIVGVEWLDNPVLESGVVCKFLSPVLVSSFRFVDGCYRRWDLGPCDDFFRILGDNLVRKFCSFYGLCVDDFGGFLRVGGVGDFVRSKRISIKSGREGVFHRVFYCFLFLEGDVELIDFAYDVGLGFKNSMGFGMIRPK